MRQSHQIARAQSFFESEHEFMVENDRLFKGNLSSKIGDKPKTAAFFHRPKTRQELGYK